MSKYAVLDTTCPNNHNLTLKFTQDEFESLLKTDELIFHCNTCQANRPPSKEEIRKIRAQFDDNN